MGKIVLFKKEINEKKNIYNNFQNMNINRYQVFQIFYKKVIFKSQVQNGLLA